MELKCLLMWLLFGSVKEGKTEKCPALPTIEFADSTAETYQLGTRLYYECDSGYKRRSGQHAVIWCQSAKHGASWDYKEFECIDEKTLLSTAPTTKSVFTQKPERKTPQKQENFSGFEQKGQEVIAKDLCGPPRTIPHASLSVNKKYYVGQVLHFKCQRGYDKRPPTSGTRTCKKENGKIIWTHLDMRCTNDTNEWPPQTTKIVSTHPSFSSSVMLPVTAISFVLFIIPAVFM